MKIQEIKKALEYALYLLEDQADKGYYSEKALIINGGNGFIPITKAIDSIGSNKSEKPDYDIKISEKSLVSIGFEKGSYDRRDVFRWSTYSNETGKEIGFQITLDKSVAQIRINAHPLTNIRFNYIKQIQDLVHSLTGVKIG